VLVVYKLEGGGGAIRRAPGWVGWGEARGPDSKKGERRHIGGKESVEGARVYLSLHKSPLALVLILSW